MSYELQCQTRAGKIPAHKRSVLSPRVTRTTLSYTWLATLLMSSSAMAQLSGGNWYYETYCSPLPGQETSYVGICETDKEAKGAQVKSGDISYDRSKLRNIYGGVSTNQNATDNVLTISGHSNPATKITGGYSTVNDAINNQVIISGGLIDGGVIEGEVDRWTQIVINGGISSFLDSAGYKGGNSTGNSITMSGGEITGNIVSLYGGQISQKSKGSVTGNSVNISGGQIRGTVSIQGGYSYFGETSDNKVTISGGQIGEGPNSASVYGGRTNDTDVVNNSVTISGGKIGEKISIDTRVIGGSSSQGRAINNNVTLTGGHVTGVKTTILGGYSNSNGASSNTVTILGGTVDATVLGGHSRTVSEVSNNTVTISGGTIGGPVAGGSLSMSDYNSRWGNLTDNTVVISGGDIKGNVYGAIHGDIYGNPDNGGFINMKNNIVTISGGTITGDVHGGAITGNVNPGRDNRSLGDATDNIVRISGGAISGNVYGGSSGPESTWSVPDITIRNRVVLAGTPTFGTDSILYGGTGTDITGNTLEVHTKNLTAKNIKNFEQVHFLLPTNTQNGNIIMNLTDIQGTDVSDTKVGVAMQAGGKLLKNGDQVALIHNANGVTTDNVEHIQLTGYQGLSLEYAFKLSSDADNLYAFLESDAKVRDQAKAPLEGRISSLAFLRQGADLAANAGIQELITPGDGVFGVISGGSSRYQSGSHIDVNGVNMMLGLKKQFATDSGKLTAAAFLEGGWGHHSTYNDFNNNIVRGSGKADYIGAGLLARQDWDSGLYAEASVRGGRVSSGWSTGDMGIQDASYDTSAAYYGAHIGLGVIVPLTERTSLDLSAKYLWTHQGGDKVTIGGDPYDFKKMDSQRTRVGARVNYAFNDRVTGYAGAAWEREHSGSARATVYGLSTPSPTLKGNTGVFEIGLIATPDAKSPLTLGLSAQGYTGKRKGASGTLNVNWAF